MASCLKGITLVMVLVCLHTSSYGQRDQSLPVFRLGLGGTKVGYSMLPTIFFEVQPIRRISLEPSASILPTFHESLRGLGSWSPAALWRYAIAVDLKYYRFLNRRSPTEGIYFFGHWDYYRSVVYRKSDDHVTYRHFGRDFGIGVGGQYYFWKRFSIDGRWSQNWGYVSHYWYNAQGSPRFFWKGGGFSWRYSLQVGFTF